MPIQVPPVDKKTSKVIPATVLAVLLLLVMAIRANPLGVIGVMVVLAAAAGYWLAT